MNNQTDIGLKFTNRVGGQGKLEKYAETLRKIQTLTKSLQKTGAINIGTVSDVKDYSEQLDQISKKLGNIMARGEGASKTLGGLFNLARIASAIYRIKRFASTITLLTDKSMDYVESINLYQVAFDNNTKSADKFVSKLSEMYGLDEKWLVNTTGLFRQLANAMNLTAETSENLSFLLTQMSIDISSLYNVDIERASEVLKSALAGLIKSLARQLKKYLLKCWKPLKTLVPKCENLKYVTMGNQHERFEF